jgi:hypothetical protein
MIPEKVIKILLRFAKKLLEIDKNYGILQISKY